VALTENQMQQRVAMFEFWYLGFATAAGQDTNAEPSPMAHAMFCPFIEMEHPHLRLSKEEKDVADLFSLEELMPRPLREELQMKLPTAARETRVAKNLLLASVYGYKMASMKSMTADGVLAAVVKAIHDSFAESLASDDPFSKPRRKR
jgi:hypothetical protein